MINKIAEKYTQLKAEHQLLQNEENKSILHIDEEMLNNFLKLYDKDVKTIHSHQETIERDLQILYKETEKMNNNTKEAMTVYNEFVEYLKVNYLFEI